MSLLKLLCFCWVLPDVSCLTLLFFLLGGVDSLVAYSWASGTGGGTNEDDGDGNGENESMLKLRWDISVGKG